MQLQLRYSADRRSLVFVAVYFGLFGYLYFGSPPPVLTAALFAACCLFSFFCAVITHNTIHSPVFVGRAANRGFQILLSLAYGGAVSAFVSGHNLSHHKHLQTRRDLMRTSKVRSANQLLNLLSFALKVLPQIIKTDWAYASLMKRRGAKWYTQYQLESAAVLLVSLALTLHSPVRALCFWFLPHFYAAWGIITINYVQHDGCDELHPYNHSRNFLGKWVNYFTFNNGYHGMHHLRPGLHWSLLPEAHAAELHQKVDERLERQSLLAYLFEILVWPAERRDYRGEALTLPEPMTDESWIPGVQEEAEDLGAVPLG